VRRALALPVFRRLMLAYGIDQLAATVAPLALSVLVYRRTGSALGAAAFFLCADVVPGFLAPPLVARLDRAAARPTLGGLYVVQALLFGVLVWLLDHFTLVPVLAVTIVIGALSAAVRPLVAAVQTTILRPLDLLRAGNSVLNIIFSSIFFVGPLIGGAIVATGGTRAALLVSCGLMVAAGLVLGLTGLPATAATEAEAPSGAGRRLRAGLAVVRSNRYLTRLIAMQWAGMVFFTLTIPVEVIYAQHTLRAGASGYGTLLAVWGGGALVGSAVYARWNRASTVTLLSGSALALLVGFGVMAIAGNLPVALVGDAIGGVANGIWAISVRTGIQEACQEEWMAIVLSVSSSGATLAPGIGIIAGGVVATLAGARGAFAGAAAGSLAVAVLVLLSLRAPAGAWSPAAPPAGDAPAPEQDRSLV
jgi:MFS family permease